VRIVAFEENKATGGIDEIRRLGVIFHVGKHFAGGGHAIVGDVGENLIEGYRRFFFGFRGLQFVELDLFEAAVTPEKSKEGSI
jgi:hypothetical protein